MNKDKNKPEKKDDVIVIKGKTMQQWATIRRKKKKVCPVCGWTECICQKRIGDIY